METCEGCGFAWESVRRDEIGPRTTAGTAAIATLLTTEAELSQRRPAAGRWSGVEYGAHVRDVMLTIRDRLVIGLIEDGPSFKPMYREERVDLGLYRDDSVAVVVPELFAAAAMFVRFFDAIDSASLPRPVQYGFPAPATRSLLWMGQQVVHEVEHHRGDIEENLRLLSAS